MPKSRYYQHRAGRHSLARFVLLAVLLCGTGFAGYKKYSGSLTWGFNPQKLVADSVLSGKTFETEVREVVSPRAKIKAYLFEDRTNPIISVSFLFKNAGLANDAESEVGISGMAASLLTTGAGDMDRLQFSEELEDRAASIGFSAGRDDFSGALLTTKAEASRAYELLSMVLTQPRFAPEDIAQALRTPGFSMAAGYISLPLPIGQRALLFGAGHISQALCPLLTTVDFRPVVFDDRPELANTSLFPTAEQVICGDFTRISDYLTVTEEDFVVIMTSGHMRDFQVEDQVLRGAFAYVGVIGSRRKTASVNQRLREAGIPEEAIALVHTPIGTPILAVTPEEIAVSIAGEMIQVRAQRRGPTPHGCPMHG